ncbi:GON1 protein, partial [Rhynochetos jubatus]|nr:GON1 protein [Rhynochetos jubatus]
MQKSRKIFANVLLLVACVDMCLAQHWSYGLQPGGKRNADAPVDPSQEIGNGMEELGEAQEAACPGSYPHSRVSDLKEAMVSNVNSIAVGKRG